MKKKVSYTSFQALKKLNFSNIPTLGFKFKELFLLIVFVTISHAAFSQACNVVAGAAFTPACTNNTKACGAGDYGSFPFVAGTYYDLTLTTSTAQGTGICINNGANLGVGPYTHLGAGTVNVAVYRGNNTWNSTSSVITYKITTPVATNGSVATICTTGSKVLSGNDAVTAKVGTGAWSVVAGAPSTSSAQFTSTTTYNTTFTPAGGAGSYTVRWTVSNGGCTAATADAVITVVAPLAAPGAITGTTPQCAGATGQGYSIGALTGAASYTWTVPTGWSVTGGGTTNSMTATAGAGGQNGNITVTGTNVCGTTSAGTLAVTVNALPAITVQPVAPAAFCAGSGSSTISVTATGAGLTYQWRKGGVNLTNVAPFSNVGTSVLTIASPAVADAGSFDVVVSGTCTPAVTSSAVAVTVNSLPAVTGQPGNNAVDAGQGTAVFTVTATGTGATYQWQEYVSGWTNISNGGVYSGATTASLTITDPTVALNGNKYRCTVSGTCTPAVNSDGLATLTINTAGIGNPTPCNAGSQSYSVTNVAGTTYTWAFPAGWVITSGQGTNQVVVTPSSTSGNVTVTPSNCSGGGTARTLITTVPAQPSVIFSE